MTKVEVDEIETIEPETAALSAEALAKTLAGGVPKNFRQQVDMEAFYRFVHDNNLREEALTIFDRMRQEKATLKALKNRVKH